MSQPSLSQYLRRLETNLETRRIPGHDRTERSPAAGTVMSSAAGLL